MRSRVGIPGYELSPPEPAEDLPPLDVPIDTAKWHQPKNQGRPQSVEEGQQEIKRHLEKLLECEAISPVVVLHASASSQVLLVTKPDTKEMRLVLCVGHMNWPLPNISHMIDERTGVLKPKKLTKFDMTKGYWQLGLVPAVRAASHVGDGGAKE